MLLEVKNKAIGIVKALNGYLKMLVSQLILKKE